MTPGADRIAAERQRQLEVEGWTPEHDAHHREGEMVNAAMSYLVAAWEHIAEEPPVVDDPPEFWPWANDWWKPADNPVRNLEKAGALIAAEIDRLTGADPTKTALEQARSVAVALEQENAQHLEPVT